MSVRRREPGLCLLLVLSLVGLAAAACPTGGGCPLPCPTGGCNGASPCPSWSNTLCVPTGNPAWPVGGCFESSAPGFFCPEDNSYGLNINPLPGAGGVQIDVTNMTADFDLFIMIPSAVGGGLCDRTWYNQYRLGDNAGLPGLADECEFLDTADIATYSAFNQMVVQVYCKDPAGGSFTITLTCVPDPGSCAPVSAPDVEPISLDNPDCCCVVLGSSETITMTIQNNDAFDATGFNVSYEVTGPINSGVITENIGALIVPAFGTLQYSFATTADFSAAGVYNVQLRTLLGSDTNPANDIMNASVDTSMVAPYVEDFETFTPGAPPGSGPGVFANGWVNEATIDQLDWYVMEGATPSGSTGPEVDFTIGDCTGNYLFMEIPSCSGGGATAYTPCYDLSGLASPVLTFYTHMYGSQMGDLWVDAFSGGVWTNGIFSLLGEQQTSGGAPCASTPWWRSPQIDLAPFGSSVMLRFRGFCNGTIGDMAIDNVEIRDLAVEEDVGTVSIDAPLDDCGLSSAETITVTLENNESVPVTNFPIEYTIAGPIPQGPVNEVVGISIPAGGTASFSFATTANFSAGGTYTITVTTLNPLDFAVGNDTAVAAVTNSPAISTFPYVEDFETFIYNPGTPGTFMNDWVNQPSPMDQIDWYVNRCQTPSGSTGPAYDNTLGTCALPGQAKYLYVETSSPAATGNEAWAITPCFDLSATGQPLLSFAYHMYGASMGSLHVDISVGGGAWVEIPELPVPPPPPYVGQQHTALGDPWLIAGPIDLSNYRGGGAVRLRFRGIRGTSYTGDMAIDDVQIIDNNPPVNPSCSITAPLAAATVTGDVDVTFDGSDPQNDPVSATFDWSDDGGASWYSCAVATSSALANPEPGMATPISGATFVWDSVADGVGLAAPVAVTIRITLDDGGPVGTCTIDVTVDNVPPPCGIGTAPCGDCDLNSFVTILDALAAARYDAGLATLSGQAFSACNVTGVQEPDPLADVTILDALTIAQFVVGIGILTCCPPGPPPPPPVPNFGEEVLLIDNQMPGILQCAGLPGCTQYFFENASPTAYTTQDLLPSTVRNTMSANDLVNTFWCIWIGPQIDGGRPAVLTNADVVAMLAPGGQINEFMNLGGIVVINGGHSEPTTVMAPGGITMCASSGGGCPGEPGCPVCPDASCFGKVVDTNHEFILGTFWGLGLTGWDFDCWDYNYGSVTPGAQISSGGVNLGTNPMPDAWNEILRSFSAPNDPAMLEYTYGAGYGLVSMTTIDFGNILLTSFNSAAEPLEQQVNYIIGIRPNYND